MIDIHRFMRSVHYALEGIAYAVVNNQNLRIQLMVAVLVIFASLFFRVNPFEMGILGVMILLVICAEMLNTAIEEMVNFVTLEHKREAKIAKDVAAGMVLITALGSIVVGILIFVPHILVLLGLR